MKFENFLADMGEREQGKVLDRIDVNGNYCPENCRWVTPRENANNTRTNRYITVLGERMTMAEASRKHGIKAANILRRLSLGWPETDAATVPVARGRVYLQGMH